LSGHPAWTAVGVFLRETLGYPHRRQMPDLDLFSPCDALESVERRFGKSNW
jgi:hypothetical protein